MDTSPLILIFSLFAASFLGSWHCAVMCGPVACFVSQKGNEKLYHLGRLLSYVFLGSLAGFFGSSIFNYFSRTQYLIVMVSINLVIIFSGLARLQVISMPKGRITSFQKRINLVFVKLFKRWAFRSSLIVGVLTGFLPCSWLYLFVFSVVSTHSAVMGGFILFIFWLGGLPALIAVTGSLGGLIKRAPQYHQRIAGLILIFAAVYSIFSFAYHIS